MDFNFNFNSHVKITLIAFKMDFISKYLNKVKFLILNFLNVLYKALQKKYPNKD